MLVTNENEIYRAKAEFELRRRNITMTEWLKWVSPHNRWDVPHLELMRESLEAIVAGEQLKVMFLAPPRHGKSEQNTVHFAAYYLYKNPKLRILLGAYNQEFANSFSLAARKLYRQCMPFDAPKNTVMEWHTDAGGALKAAGLDAGVTGRGGNLLLFDDPIKNRKTAYSKDQRETIWKNYSVDFYTRREPGASMVYTATPWHHDDVGSRILNSKDGKNWLVIEFPAIAKENDIIGRKEGEALWPWRFPIEELNDIHEVIGDEFLALYQLAPSIVTGNIFKRAWFIEEETKDWPIRFDYTGQYWDSAEKTKKDNDYSVCATIAKHRGTRYLLNVFREKLEFPELKGAVKEQAMLFQPHYIGIEDKSSGTQALQELTRDNDLPVKPEAINPQGTKEARAKAVTPMVKNDGIKIPKGAPWISDFLDEITMFPLAGHDDQVDAFSHGLNHQRDVGYNLLALIGKK